MVELGLVLALQLGLFGCYGQIRAGVSVWLDPWVIIRVGDIDRP